MAQIFAKKGDQMKIEEVPQKDFKPILPQKWLKEKKKQRGSIKKHPTCLAALDFEILCRLEGKASALRVFLMIIAIKKEKELNDAYYKNRPRPKPVPPTRPLTPMGDS